MQHLTLLPHRGVLRLSGPDRATFLQGLITQDINKIRASQAIYTALLTPQGRFLHDLFIAVDGEHWLMDCERARTGDLKTRLSLYKLRSQISLEDANSTYQVGAIWGDGVLNPFPIIPGVVLFKDPRLPELGIRFMATASGLKTLITTLNLKETPFQDYDQLRLSLGIPDGSRDIPIEKGIILESGFDELNAIDWQKGCYIGQELTARTRYQGLLRKRLLPVVITGPTPQSGEIITLEGKEVGKLCSSSDSKGLALLRIEALDFLKNSQQSLICGQATLNPSVPTWMRLSDIEG
jgi:folate-binding protein YgfZ